MHAGWGSQLIVSKSRQKRQLRIVGEPNARLRIRICYVLVVSVEDASKLQVELRDHVQKYLRVTKLFFGDSTVKVIEQVQSRGMQRLNFCGGPVVPSKGERPLGCHPLASFQLPATAYLQVMQNTTTALEAEVDVYNTAHYEASPMLPT